jgi:hypothetical protein
MTGRHVREWVLWAAAVALVAVQSINCCPSVVNCEAKDCGKPCCPPCTNPTRPDPRRKTPTTSDAERHSAARPQAQGHAERAFGG